MSPATFDFTLPIRNVLGVVVCQNHVLLGLWIRCFILTAEKNLHSTRLLSTNSLSFMIYSHLMSNFSAEVDKADLKSFEARMCMQEMT